MKDMIKDISTIDYTSRITVENPKNYEACVKIKEATNARICVGCAGTGLRTETYLRFLCDHAAANDAVWADVNEKVVDQFNFFKVKTIAKNKEEFLKNPNVGRKFSNEVMNEIDTKCKHNIDVQIIVGDGLSAYAIERNVGDMYPILTDGLKLKGYTVGTPIYVKYSRVATMDKISEILNAKVTILLIGERPGLITNQSLSCYMAYESSTKKPESQRTVISNIYNDGTPPVEAAAQIVHFAEILIKEKKSGAELKI